MKFSDALTEAEQWIDSISGVERVSEGVENGEPCITVFVSSKSAATQLPTRVGPWAVIVDGVFGRRRRPRL